MSAACRSAMVGSTAFIQADFADVATLATSRLIPAQNRGDADEVRARAEQSGWLGPQVECFSDAQKLAEQGWSAGASEIQKIREGMALEVPPPRSIRRRPLYADEGGELDRDRLYGGQIDTMWRTAKRRDSSGPRTIELVCQIGGLREVSQENMFATGAAAAITVDLLENAGFRVGLSGFSFAKNPKAFGHVAVLTRIKEANEPLRLDSLAFAVAHAGFFRFLTFAMRAWAPVRCRPQKCSSDRMIDPHVRRLVAAGVMEADVVFSGLESVRQIAAAVHGALDAVQGPTAGVR